MAEEDEKEDKKKAEEAAKKTAKGSCPLPKDGEHHHIHRHQFDQIKKEMSFDPKDSKEVSMAKLKALQAANETLKGQIARH